MAEIRIYVGRRDAVMHRRRPGMVKPNFRVSSRDLPSGQEYKSFAVGLVRKNCQTSNSS